MDENRQELLEIAADDFLGKPFREAEIFQRITFSSGWSTFTPSNPRPGGGGRTHFRVAGVGRRN